MRLSVSKIVLTSLALCVAGGANCPLPGIPGTSIFPKTAAWNPRTVNTGANVRPAAVEVADFDGDGNLDIVAGYPGLDPVVAAVHIFFQTDLSTFTSVEIATGADLTGLAALAVADMDGDTHSDIIAACNGRLVYLHSPTDPRQGAGWTMSTLDESTGSDFNQWNDVAVGSMDGLNGPDVVACNANIGRLSWFASPAANVTSGTGWTRTDIDATTRTNAAAVALLDIDGDTRIDVFSTAPGETSARVAWYANPTDPVGSPWTKYTIGNLTAADRIALGDLNADGRSDIVAINPTGRQIGWYMRPVDPTGTWSGSQLTQFSSNAPSDVKVADIDGNNQPDVVVATQNGGTLRWFTPIGVQTQQWAENNLRDLTENVARIALADIDKDGRPDVVAALLGATTAQDSIAWFENPEP